jgi:hypothetical protein
VDRWVADVAPLADAFGAERAQLASLLHRLTRVDPSAVARRLGISPTRVGRVPQAYLTEAPPRVAHAARGSLVGTGRYARPARSGPVTLLADGARSL